MSANRLHEKSSSLPFYGYVKVPCSFFIICMVFLGDLVTGRIASPTDDDPKSFVKWQHLPATPRAHLRVEVTALVRDNDGLEIEMH